MRALPSVHWSAPIVRGALPCPPSASFFSFFFSLISFLGAGGTCTCYNMYVDGGQRTTLSGQLQLSPYHMGSLD